MTPLEAKDKAAAFLQDKYEETFELALTDIHQSAALPGYRYAFRGWPQNEPQYAFPLSIDSESGVVDEDYWGMRASYNARADILPAFERYFTAPYTVKYLSLGLPVGGQLFPDDSLAETLGGNEGEVSLNFTLYAGVDRDAFRPGGYLNGLAGFIEEFVKKRGFLYLLLGVYFVDKDALAEYTDNESFHYQKEPAKEHLAATFWVNAKAQELSTAEDNMAQYLALNEKEEEA